MRRRDWREVLHPRDQDGRFAHVASHGHVTEAVGHPADPIRDYGDGPLPYDGPPLRDGEGGSVFDNRDTSHLPITRQVARLVRRAGYQVNKAHADHEQEMLRRQGWHRQMEEAQTRHVGREIDDLMRRHRAGEPVGDGPFLDRKALGEAARMRDALGWPLWPDVDVVYHPGRESPFRAAGSVVNNPALEPNAHIVGFDRDHKRAKLRLHDGSEVWADTPDISRTSSQSERLAEIHADATDAPIPAELDDTIGRLVNRARLAARQGQLPRIPLPVDENGVQIGPRTIGEARTFLAAVKDALRTDPSWDEASWTPEPRRRDIERQYDQVRHTYRRILDREAGRAERFPSMRGQGRTPEQLELDAQAKSQAADLQDLTGDLGAPPQTAAHLERLLARVRAEHQLDQPESAARPADSSMLPGADGVLVTRGDRVRIRSGEADHSVHGYQGRHADVVALDADAGTVRVSPRGTAVEFDLRARQVVLDDDTVTATERIPPAAPPATPPGHRRTHRVQVGDTVTVELPYSEVNMHMNVAGQVRAVRIEPLGAQILNDDGTPFSFPINHGEAGIHVRADRTMWADTYGAPRPAALRGGDGVLVMRGDWVRIRHLGDQHQTSARFYQGRRADVVGVFPEDGELAISPHGASIELRVPADAVVLDDDNDQHPGADLRNERIGDRGPQRGPGNDRSTWTVTGGDGADIRAGDTVIVNDPGDEDGGQHATVDAVHPAGDWVDVRFAGGRRVRYPAEQVAFAGRPTTPPTADPQPRDGNMTVLPVAPAHPVRGAAGGRSWGRAGTIYVGPGSIVHVELPDNNTTRQMGVAGQERTLRVYERGVRVLNPDGTPMWPAIPHSHAGLRRTRDLYGMGEELDDANPWEADSLGTSPVPIANDRNGHPVLPGDSVSISRALPHERYGGRTGDVVAVDPDNNEVTVRLYGSTEHHRVPADDVVFFSPDIPPDDEVEGLFGHPDDDGGPAPIVEHADGTRVRSHSRRR